jgi:hypothetical protein
MTEHLSHLYIITEPNVLPPLPIISDFKDDNTIITLSPGRIEGSLTHEISKHFQNLKNLTIDQFDWIYYTQKYPDLSTLKEKKTAWEHWKGQGSKESRNPLDCRTISQWEDVNRNVALLTILIHAETNKFKKIVILEITKEVGNISNFEQIIRSHQSVIAQKPLVILSQAQQAYAYILDASIYSLFISELSLFIASFESIMQIYEGSFNNQSVVFDYPRNREPRQLPKSNQKLKSGHLAIDINSLSKAVSQARYRYYKTEYEKYINELNPPLLISELLCLNQLMCKYAYDDIKYKFNAHISLKLLISLITQSYWVPTDTGDQSIGDFKILKRATDIDRYGCVVFSHEFYLTLYPCYRTVFKNATDSYNHFINCGKKERLIGNELIFKLIKVIQDDQRDHLLHLVRSNHLKNVDSTQLSPIFYDAHNRRYYGSDKPLFYVLTRTCNREALFAKCCESIAQQAFVNVRHVVGYDNEETKRYVRQYKHIYKNVDLIAKKGRLHPNQYIDTFYEQIEHSGPGWVMILDDDDQFMTNLALATLEPYTKNPNNLIVWMLYRPDKFIYPKDKKKPVVGEIASCCYLYHTSKLAKGKWGGNAIGDFYFFQHLFSQTQPEDVIYLDYPLTGVNYENQISGWAAL